MTVQIRGLDKLQRKLRTVAKIERKLKPWARRTLKRAEKETDYTQSSPPRRAGQQYIRTFRLRGQWKNQIRIGNKAIMARRHNSRTPYGLWVMGRRTQTGIFRGRWQTDADIERKIAPASLKDLKQVVDKELAK